MGTDIHLVVQRRLNGVWERVEVPEELVDPYWKKRANEGDEDGYYKKKAIYDWYSDRNYKCFSILANVRNETGFAGIDTGDGFIPISEPRGTPEDLGNGIDLDDWDLGDHSFSWLLLSELLAYDWTRTTKHRGVIRLEAFIERINNKDTSWPEAYSGWIFGSGIVVLSRKDALAQMQDKGIIANNDLEIYVQEEWESTYAEAARRFYTEIIPALQKLDPNPDNVRIVFGFDS